MIMRESKRKANKDKGFTMIEMIFVLVVLVIMAAVFMSRYVSTGTNELMIETDGLKTSLRYAQIKAMNDTLQPNSNPRWELEIGNATSYTLYRRGDNGVRVSANLPGEVTTSPIHATHVLSGGVTVTSGVGLVITFNDWGSPGSSNISITLAQGTQSGNIGITKNTGFIQ
jgi:prepilin-type N-terminal cleavage/methylation domain-containing protein